MKPRTRTSIVTLLENCIGEGRASLYSRGSLAIFFRRYGQSNKVIFIFCFSEYYKYTTYLPYSSLQEREKYGAKTKPPKL